MGPGLLRAVLRMRKASGLSSWQRRRRLRTSALRECGADLASRSGRCIPHRSDGGRHQGEPPRRADCGAGTRDNAEGTRADPHDDRGSRGDLRKDSDARDQVDHPESTRGDARAVQVIAGPCGGVRRRLGRSARQAWRGDVQPVMASVLRQRRVLFPRQGECAVRLLPRKARTTRCVESRRKLADP